MLSTVLFLSAICGRVATVDRTALDPRSSCGLNFLGKSQSVYIVSYSFSCPCTYTIIQTTRAVVVRSHVPCADRSEEAGAGGAVQLTTERRESTRALLATSAVPLYDLCCFFSPHAIPAMHDSPPFGHITRHGHAIDHTTTQACTREKRRRAGERRAHATHSRRSTYKIESTGSSCPAPVFTSGCSRLRY